MESPADTTERHKQHSNRSSLVIVIDVDQEWEHFVAITCTQVPALRRTLCSASLGRPAFPRAVWSRSQHSNHISQWPVIALHALKGKPVDRCCVSRLCSLLGHKIVFKYSPRGGKWNEIFIAGEQRLLRRGSIPVRQLAGLHVREIQSRGGF